VVVKVKIDTSRVDEATKQLNEVVVPMVRQAPGVQSGIWTPSAEGEGLSIVAYDTEEHAKAGMAMIPDPPGPGVTLVSAEVRRVAASF
jgi:hypothetical protein